MTATHETRPLDASDDSAVSKDAPPSVKGRVVGRYVLLERLGAGGSGEVFSAFDPTLDRQVALKLLHRPDAGSDALVREGRLLAKLVHPNVVAVHDSGVDDGQPYLAMQLVDGPDVLDFAAAQRELPARGVLLDVLRAVGEGLAAAHHIGLVHGDVKPSNVLIDRAGHAKLSDFGIAQLADSEMLSGAGTPAFMAPEQHEGQPGSALCDQYSFCLTAFVLFHGEHPFVGGDQRSVTAAAVTRTPKQWTAGTDDRRWSSAQNVWTPRWTSAAIPSGLARAFERGLCVDPARRWPDMEALLEALAQRPTRRAWPWLVALGGAGALAAGMASTSDEPPPKPCAHAGEAIEEAWDVSGERALRQAWSSDTGAFSSSLEHVVETIDTFSDRWETTSRSVCEATHEHGLQSRDMLDIRSDCLRRAQVSLNEAVTLIAVDDPQVWSEAVDVVSGLPDPRRCADTQTSWLAADVDPELRARLERADRMIERARYSLDAVALDRAADALSVAEDDALADGAVAGRFLRQQARLSDWQGHGEAARDAAKRALLLALEHDDVVSAVSMASMLAETLGRNAGKTEEALDYARMTAALSRRPDATVEEAYHAAVAMGSLRTFRGEHEEALRELEQAPELAAQAFGAEHPEVATARAYVALALHDAARYGEAETQLERVLDARVRIYGPNHPFVAQVHHNLSRLYYDMGRPESEEHTRKALEILVTSMGPEQLRVATVRGGLGDELRRGGRHEEALEQYEAALEILDELAGLRSPDALVLRVSRGFTLHMLGREDEAFEVLDAAISDTREVLGPKHFYLARALLFRGSARLRSGRFEGAAADYAASRDVYVAAGNEGHPGRVRAVLGLARVAQRAGDLEKSEAVYQEAEALLEATGEPADALRAQLDEGIGRLALDQERYGEAQTRLTRALSQFVENDESPKLQADVMLALAKAERGAGNRADALAHVRAAGELLDGAAMDDPQLRAELGALERDLGAQG